MEKEQELEMKDGFYHIQNKDIDYRIDKYGNGIVFMNYDTTITRCFSAMPAFSIISNGQEINFIISRVQKEDAGIFGRKGKRYIIYTNDNKNSGLAMIIRLSAPEEFNNVLLSDLEIINRTENIISLDTVISHRYSLLSQPGDVPGHAAPFWAFCGGSYPERFDWIEPLQEGFFRENSMHPNGGNPYTGIWNPEYGLGIMSLELRQEPLVLPVSMEAEDRVNISIKEPVNIQMEPGQSWRSTTYAVLVHNGDVYNGLATWSQLLQAKGMELPESPESCYEPIWCGWGYESDYTNEELLSTLPVAQKMGLKWAVVDFGWQDRSTFWELSPGKYPDGDATMRAFTDSVKASGMHPKLWFCPGAATYSWPEQAHGEKGSLFVPDERMLLLDRAGNTIDYEFFGISFLCPAEEAVVDISRAFICKAMLEWGFEGFKIDGEYFNLFPPCYNPAHEHASPLESSHAGPLLLKAMYEEAISIDSNTVFEICCCGTNFSFYNMPFSNQMVASDPLSSWQIRHRAKVYRALLGSNVAYYGDHVELSDNGNDFASTIGVGGVPGTKFTLIESREMNEGSKLLTPENKKIWEKFFRAYNEEMPSEGRYLNLYDIVYDCPEVHVLQKQGVLYYGIFSNERYNGKIILKGLAAGTEYSLIDYINNEMLSDNVSRENNEISIEFDKYLLLKALPTP